MRRRPRNLIARLSALLAMLVVVLLGAVHRPAERTDPGLLAFLEMGGTMDALCLDEGDDGAVHAECPACVLAKSLFAPSPTAITARKRSAPLARVAFVAAERVTPHAPRAPPGRGPPQLA